MVPDTSFYITCLRFLRIALPFLTIGLVFFCFILQPQSHRLKSQESILKQLKKGTRITTVHGITGKVCQASENFIILELDDGRKIEIIRTVIAVIHHE